MTSYVKPPPKPKRMSEKRYRELYDSKPVLVTCQTCRTRTKCCGAVSAEVVAGTCKRKNHDVELAWTA